MNKFSGTLYYADSKPVPNANVIVTVNKTSIKESTVTDTNGKWNVSLKEDVDPKDIKILFSKSGYQSKQVNGPIQTATLEGFIDPEKGGTLNLQGLFPSGKYKVESLSGEDKEVLDHELEDLFQFIKRNPGNVQIKIRSSESQVPNADNEGTGKDFSQPGSLAKERGLTLRKYIEDELNKKINSDTSIQNPDNFKPVFNYTESDISRVGDKLWERNNPDVIAENAVLVAQEEVTRSADLSKYKKDQYVAVDVELILTPKTKDCTASNLFLFVMYLTKELGGKGAHGCNSALYTLYANGQLLKRTDGQDYASLNNDPQYNGGTIPTAPDYYNIFEKNKYEEKLVFYENTKTNYNRKGPNRKKLPPLYDLKIDDKYIPTTDEYTRPPGVSRERFNAFFLTSDLLKKLTDGKPNKIITFEIACYNPTNWTDPGGEWDKNCHKGVGSFKIIRIDEDTKIKGAYVVSEASNIINAATPDIPEKKVKLLTYDLCAEDPTKALKFEESLIKKGAESKGDKGAT